MCGEHYGRTWEEFLNLGSSPRVRGTLGDQKTKKNSRRFIPACAGNTSTPSSRREQGKVHPRVCGEHGAYTPEELQEKGSSPRVRGTQSLLRLRCGCQGFIPACAGNTYRINSSASGFKVHPRVCGEHLGKVPPCAQGKGSSPRVRGTRLTESGKVTRTRFIPACAGNTNAPQCGQGTFQVHPRVCGEHKLYEHYNGSKKGSSPRVRGTRNLFTRWHYESRFIPACAGNT